MITLGYKEMVMNIQLVESIKQLILSLSEDEQSWLKTQLVQEKGHPEDRVVDLNLFRGILQLQEDPLEFQRQIRDEWT
jgi:signal transduction protein with GAF and PtsI domain